MAELRDANTNPWYVLMTLCGEQEGEEVDWELHDQNRMVWNAWSCQGLDEAAAADVAEQAGVGVAETRSWEEMATEVKRMHRAVMEQRSNDVEFAYPGFPDFESPIDCSNTRFHCTVVLKNCIFTQRAYFKGATFTQIADVRSATFTQRSYFEGAIFTKYAIFRSASFIHVADFSRATFIQVADFTKVTFTQDAGFPLATFTQGAQFSLVTFTQGVYFSRAAFTQGASFINTNFEGPAKFLEVKFGVRDGAEVCRADFTEAAFAKVASFREAEFVSHYPKLEGTQFREGVVLSAKAAFWPVEGKGATELDARETEQAKESCAALRHALAKQGVPEEEHFFFRREMGFAAQIDGWWQRLPYRLFGWFSEYGNSIARPVEWLCGVFGLGAGMFAAGLNAGSLLSAVGEGAALSFSNLLPLFGFGRLYFDGEYMAELPTFLQVFSGAQTVLALPLLFFLGLALRKRFRLR